MKELSIKEEKELYAGGGITTSFINAITRGFTAILDVGRYIGSSIRRIFNHNMCD